MQYLLVLLLTLTFYLSLNATPQEEIETIEQLIETTKKNLENQRLVLKYLQTYSSAREAYFADPDSNRLATALVKRAVVLYQLVESEHLSHLFATDFLTELAFYYQVGKRSISHE